MSLSRWLTLVALVTALIGGLCHYKHSEIAAAIAEAETYPEHSEVVEAVETSETRFIPRLSLPGEVVVSDRITLRAQLAGQISQIGFQPGEAVESGQLLVQLDIAEEEARLLGARAEAELARAEFERARTLLTSGTANRARVENAEAALNIALSSLAVIQEAIERKTITAPFAGVTNPDELVVGQYLEIGDTIAEITGQQGQVWVDFRVPQFQSAIEEDARLEVKLANGQNLPGELVARNANIDATSRTRLHRLVVENTSATGLIHGAFVEVSVPAGPEQTVIDIPVAALQSDAYGQFVHVLEPARDVEGTFRAARRDVGDIYYQGDRALVAWGLAEGLLIATDGAFKLYSGVLVYVVDELPTDPDPQAAW